MMSLGIIVSGWMVLNETSDHILRLTASFLLLYCQILVYCKAKYQRLTIY